MKRLFLVLSVVLAFALFGFAQGTSSSTSTSKTTKTTSKAKTAKSGTHQLTGCLSGPDASGAYTLTNGHYKKGIEVGGNDELAKHVGHEVQLTGTWESSGKAIGESEKEEKQEKTAEKHFKVDSIKHMADSCSMPAAKSKGKKGASK